jgi:hypothetical protein
MSRLTILENIQIASPCEADWSEMTGDDRTRFCGSCSKHVYNIASMTAEEATSLIVETEGRVCLRVYKRADGTVLTSDCPVGLAKVGPGRRVRRALALGLVLPALAVAGVTAKGFTSRRIDPFPTGPGATWNDRIDWALVTLGLRTPAPSVTMGEMLPVSLGTPAPLPPSATPGGSAPVCDENPVIVEP